MTYDDAIRLITIYQNRSEEGSLSYEAFDMAVNALKKEIPKEPDTNLSGGYPKKSKLYWCGRCGSRITRTKGNRTLWCHRCGQAVDWGVK